MKQKTTGIKQVFRRKRGPTWFSPTQVSYILRTCFSRSSSILPSPPRLDSPDTKIRTRIEMIRNNSAKCKCEYLQIFTRIVNPLLDSCNLQLFILDPVKKLQIVNICSIKKLYAHVTDNCVRLNDTWPYLPYLSFFCLKTWAPATWPRVQLPAWAPARQLPDLSFSCLTLASAL